MLANTILELLQRGMVMVSACYTHTRYILRATYRRLT
uniref:Uncharacterized protein n=1 Tax=Anguilla anguilla TaxID=7936 RepID=A0A0E9S098_ANGAN